eukprot:m.347789 g.347789  ORF g.347789 m.347789 type:complete len:300 (-) comp34070_c0_seq1:137-1036(-)
MENEKLIRKTENLHVTVSTLDSSKFYVATISLARHGKEQHNPMTTPMLRELISVARFLSSDDEIARMVKVVVFKGLHAFSGGSFTVGMDLGEVTNAGSNSESHNVQNSKRTATETVDVGAQMANAVENIPAVTIACISRHCIGGGVVLASACDLRLASLDTIFSIPEIKIGIPLAFGGNPRLIRDIGVVRARELVMTGRKFSAEDALHYGFLNHAVPSQDLEAKMRALVLELMCMSRLTLRMTKSAMNSISGQMVSIGHSWSDASQFVAATLDPESRQVAMRYAKEMTSRTETRMKAKL